MSTNTSSAPITQCLSCSGDLTFNPAAQTLDCLFCKSTYTLKGKLVSAEAVIKEAPQLIIPFTFNKEVFEKAAIEWVSQGQYTPGDVLDSLHNNSAKGVYVPIYIWQISYVIASPTGNKKGSTKAVNVTDDHKEWPTLLPLANSLTASKGSTKPFDKVYTLGFEIVEQEVFDVDDFNAKNQKFAIDTVIAENQLQDGKSVSITEMSLTKIYAPFWLNKYNYQSQNYEVIMSGSDASKIGGSRPVDQAALAATPPSFKPAFLTLLGTIVVIVATVVATLNNATGIFDKVLNFACGASVLIMVLVVPIMFIVAFTKRATWVNPVIKLSKERSHKLAQRMQQRL